MEDTRTMCGLTQIHAPANASQNSRADPDPAFRHLGAENLLATNAMRCAGVRCLLSRAETCVKTFTRA